MSASSKSNGSMPFERSRSMFQEWKNSWDMVPRIPARWAGLRRAPRLETTVLLRCSMPSPSAHGR